MNHEQIDHIRESFRTLAPRGPELFATFVQRLTAAAPALRAVFPAQPADHAQEFLAPCGMVIKNLHRLNAIEYLLLDIGAKNQRRGVLPQHYGVARDALLATLAEAHGDDWSDHLADDWSDAVNFITSLMIRGAGRARSKAA
jgi:hemoglobin-like flavoprotein